MGEDAPVGLRVGVDDQVPSRVVNEELSYRHLEEADAGLAHKLFVGQTGDQGE